MAELVAVELNFGEVAEALSELERRGGNVRDVMPTIAQVLVTAVEDAFETEGAATVAGKWEDLAEATKAARRGTTFRILQDTGRLAGSIGDVSGPDWAEAGTNVEYAIFHVSKEPREVIPLRDFLDVLTDETMAEVADTILEEVVR